MVTSLLRPKEVKESKEEEKHTWGDQGKLGQIMTRIRWLGHEQEWGRVRAQGSSEQEREGSDGDSSTLGR